MVITVQLLYLKFVENNSHQNHYSKDCKITKEKGTHEVHNKVKDICHVLKIDRATEALFENCRNEYDFVG